jgi:hypothetical protein
LAALLSLTVLLQCSGCLAVAVVSTASAVAIVAVKTTGKVAVAAVSTTGRVASAALTSSGEVTALTLESAAQLAKTGKVVMVDGGSGALVELPWKDGMKLYQAAQAGQFSGSFNAAKIFRNGRLLAADLKKVRAGATDPLLSAGDVVELRH